jgi:hypothetical protein
MKSKDIQERATQLSSATRTAGGVSLLLGCLLAIPSRLEATSVVALIDPAKDRVVIAADCRVNRSHGAVEKCKIIEEPDCVVAIAGLYEEATTGFHLRQLVHAACQQVGDLREKAETFLRISQAPFERAVKSIREAQPDSFAKTMANKPTEVVFAGIQDGHVALIVRGLVADSKGKVSVERFESIAPSYARAGYFLGLNGHIRAHVKSHPGWAKEDPAKLARQFVEMEMAAHPDLAGPPISELQIDKNGHVHWLDKGACESPEGERTTHETIGN